MSVSLGELRLTCCTQKAEFTKNVLEVLIYGALLKSSRTEVDRPMEAWVVFPFRGP